MLGQIYVRWSEGQRSQAWKQRRTPSAQLVGRGHPQMVRTGALSVQHWAKRRPWAGQADAPHLDAGKQVKHSPGEQRCPQEGLSILPPSLPVAEPWPGGCSHRCLGAVRGQAGTAPSWSAPSCGRGCGSVGCVPGRLRPIHSGASSRAATEPQRLWEPRPRTGS